MKWIVFSVIAGIFYAAFCCTTGLLQGYMLCLGVNCSILAYEFAKAGDE